MSPSREPDAGSRRAYGGRQLAEPQIRILLRLRVRTNPWRYAARPAVAVAPRSPGPLFGRPRLVPGCLRRWCPVPGDLDARRVRVRRVSGLPLVCLRSHRQPHRPAQRLVYRCNDRRQLWVAPLAHAPTTVPRSQASLHDNSIWSRMVIANRCPARSLVPLWHGVPLP